MRRFMQILLVSGILALAVQISLPTTYAIACQFKMSIESQSAVDPGQTFEVKTHLTIGCPPTSERISTRVDVVALASNSTLSRSSYGIGAIDVPNKVVNVTLTNSVQAPSEVGSWKLEVVAWLFSAGNAGTSVVGVLRQPVQVQVGKVVQVTSTQTSTQTTASTTTASVSTGVSYLGTFGAVGVVVAVGLIAVLMVFMRRRKPQTPVLKQVAKEKAEYEVPQAGTVGAPLQNISTGYPDFDTVLAGGLPVGYAILIVSPPCDEKDLLFTKIIESGLSVGSSIFFLSRDLGRTQDLARKYRANFYAFCPQADRISTEHGNVFKISGVQNLNDVNISISKGVETLGTDRKNKIIIMDILSDVLLEHKALTTRKWLDDFVAKRKSEGFTILGTLNPLIASKQESQTIIDLFDGIIEIYEKELRERARRFLIVKKMYGRRYIETELMLDKDKLF